MTGHLRLRPQGEADATGERYEIPGLVGVQWWNLCDFKTAQGTLRPKALNHKGLFTRERRPKAAAHAVRARWTAD